MRVWHGTGDYALKDLLNGEPIRKRRAYVPKPCFCATLSFRVASLFAMRKTSFEDFLKGIVSGVVVEYELGGVEGKDFCLATDPCCMQDEQEVAVFNVDRLVPLATWRHAKGEWTSGCQLGERS